MVALFSLGISSTLGTYAMLPLYLVSSQGIDHSSANTLLAASRVAALPMAFAGGWLADRFGPLSTIRLIFLLTGLATIAIGLLKGPWLQGAVFCQPVLAVCFFPAGFSALSALSPPNYRNIAVLSDHPQRISLRWRCRTACNRLVRRCRPFPPGLHPDRPADHPRERPDAPAAADQPMSFS